MKFKKKLKRSLIISLGLTLGLNFNGVRNIQNVNAQEIKREAIEKKNLEGIITSEIVIDKEIYYAGPNYVLDKEKNPVSDEGIVYKALEMRDVLEKIAEGAKYEKQLKLLGWFAKGQEITIKHSEHIEWGLTLPAKILSNLTTGAGITESIANETKDHVLESFKDIADNPEKHFKHLAYEHFSKAREKYDENMKIIEKVKNGALLDYATAKKYEENSKFITQYGQAAQTLYHDILNERPLEERWAEEFMKPISSLLDKNIGISVDKETLEKILKHTDDELTEYGPYEKFRATVEFRAEKYDEVKKEREKRITNMIRELTKTYEDKKDYKTESLERSVEDQFEKYFGQGKEYINLEKWGLSASSFEKALEIKPKHEKTLELLSAVYEECGREYEDKKEYDKAIETYKKITIFQPNEYKSHLRLGIVYGTIATENYGKDMNKSKEFYDKGTKELGKGLVGLSDLHGGRIPQKEVESYFKLAMLYQTQLGEIYAREKNFDESINCLEYAVNVAEGFGFDYVRCRVILGESYKAKGFETRNPEWFDKALTAYGLALMIEPNNEDVIERIIKLKEETAGME